MADFENQRCARCQKLMGADSASFGVHALGQAWHKECFKCKYCNNKIFSFAKFFEEAGQPVCATCNTNKAVPCGYCGKPCTTNHISSQGKEWHQECFKCHGCKKNFGPDGFFEDEGKLWHLQCYAAQAK